ncbi:MAG: hypothetical protein QNK20_16570 [Aureibaculum sp.]|nr:hypothetical protein [Aureibaculum sp.]
MAVRDTTYEVIGTEQALPFHSENTELSKILAHVIIEGLTNFPVTLRFYQGNIDNMRNKEGEIQNSDVLVRLKDCEDVEDEQEITANGVYFIAIDYFYGKYGEMRLMPNTNNTGTIRGIINTIKKY